MTTEQKHTLTCGVNQSFNGYCDCGAESKPAPAPLPSNLEVIREIAAATAHRACCGTEHDPENGKLHGCCVVCGVPWPCDTAKVYLRTPVETKAPRDCPRCGGEGMNYSSAYLAGCAPCLLCHGSGRVIQIGENRYKPAEKTKTVCPTHGPHTGQTGCIYCGPEKTNDGLPPFYTERKCSQCGATEERIQREGCPEKCGRTAGDVSPSQEPT